MFEQIDRNPGASTSSSTIPAFRRAERSAIFVTRTSTTCSASTFFGPLYIASEAAKRLPDGGRIINFGSNTSQGAGSNIAELEGATPASRSCPCRGCRTPRARLREGLADLDLGVGQALGLRPAGHLVRSTVNPSGPVTVLPSADLPHLLSLMRLTIARAGRPTASPKPASRWVRCGAVLLVDAALAALVAAPAAVVAGARGAVIAPARACHHGEGQRSRRGRPMSDHACHGSPLRRPAPWRARRCGIVTAPPAEV